MEHERVTLRMNTEMERVLRQMARDDDVTPGQLIRGLVAKEITRRTKTRPPIRADEQLIAPLRARLAPDLGQARDWEDLAERLRAKGYILREAGGGLALHDWPADNRVCKASELGFSYGRLMQRFRKPFPGHSHSWLCERALSRAAKPPDDGDTNVIEPV